MGVITSAIIAGGAALAGAATSAVGAVGGALGGLSGIAGIAGSLIPTLLGGKGQTQSQPVQQIQQQQRQQPLSTGPTAKELEDKAALDSRRQTLSKARSRTQTVLSTQSSTEAGKLQRKTLLGQ